MTPASDVFTLLRAALEAAGIRYAIGGSWASTAFGEPRFTNDVDILADFAAGNVSRFLAALPATFFADAAEIVRAINAGRPFNVIYMPMAFKFDFFPAAAFPLGIAELDRAVWMAGSGLSESPAPFVTPEDILLAKLHWLGGVVSEVQWRDTQGIVRNRGASLDRQYLVLGAEKLGVEVLLARALASQ